MQPFEKKYSPVAESASAVPTLQSTDHLTPDDESRISEYAEQALHPSTRSNYEEAWGRFKDFCEKRDASTLPATPEIVAAYLAKRAEDVTAQTVSRDSSAIAWKHDRAGLQDPTSASGVRRVRKGIRRRADPDEGYGKRKALLTDDIRAIVHALPLERPPAKAGLRRRAKYMRALRDRALILLGFAGAFRSSELTSVRVEDVTHNERGIEVRVLASKTGPRKTGINCASTRDLCPVYSLRKWTKTANIEAGPLFRAVGQRPETDPDHQATPLGFTAVWRLITRAAEAAGIDPDQVGTHSLRRGHITQAKLNGADLEDIRRHVGHEHLKATAEYIAEANRMEMNTSQNLGL